MIRVSSQKGEVGKTTIAVNLAVSLGMLNYKVLVIDGDVVSPAVAFLLGIEDVNIGVREVMRGKVNIKNAIVRHDVSGIDVLPGTQSPRDFPSEKEMKTLITKAQAQREYDFIIMDTPPGYTPAALPELYNEALIISIPTMASVASSIRLADIYNKKRVQHNLVINRIRNTRYELTSSEIEEGYGGKSIISLPEDPKVPFSESSHIPLCLLDSKSPFSSALKVLVRFYAAKKGASMNREPEAAPGFFARLTSRIRKLFSRT
jgi:MinD-like ATPase involved in chromosome partitioning or flagellar assembly